MDLKLSSDLTRQSDFTLLYRELSVYSKALEQKKIRKNLNAIYSLPRVSDKLKSLALENSINLENQNECEIFLKALDDYKKNIIVIHISFPQEPSEECLQKLVFWFRENVDSKILLKVGLQPSIAAGVIVRTSSKYFDFSLRKHLYNQKIKLKEVLNSGV